MIAKVVLNSNSVVADNLYDYLIPDVLESKIKIGSRVSVSFGKGNKTCEAFVYKITQHSEYQNIKSINNFIDDYIYFDEKATELIDFMRHRYFCSYISALRCLIPPGLNIKYEEYISLVSEKKEDALKFSKNSVTASKIIAMLESYGTTSLSDIKSNINKGNTASVIKRLASNGFVTIDTKSAERISDTKKTYVELLIERYEAYEIIDEIRKQAPARARVLEFLCEFPEIELSELLEYASTTRSTVNALVTSGFVAYTEVVCNSSDIITNYKELKRRSYRLNTYQQHASDVISDSIISNQKKTYLIHGVTGSGKTEVYLELIEKTISLNKNAIMLVPEISLTPQMISQIYSRFGNDVAVLHSKLTIKQRFVEWKRIRNGEVKIAIGARSAIFAPFSDIGLIIIDEEHETTYKAEMSPKYNTIELARIISRQHNSVLVLASATPSVESYFKAENGLYDLIEMPQRVNKTELPDVTIVDMRNEITEGNMSIFSNELKNKIKRTLDKKEQAILFLNRRGFSGFVSCRNCGYVMQCPNCNISLKFHKYTNRMVCHYCDYKTDAARVCPQCNSKHIRYFGIGTERVVDEITTLFPEAGVLRMDADTTVGKYSHEKIVSSFRNGEADILVGTQMITKGLDFANVTLVGIIAADMSLNMDDYRAGERTFDLITQVVGRAGRAEKKGEAVIQTYNPDDEVIILSANQDYKSFYENEIKIRRILINPPFNEFVNFLFVSESCDCALECAEKVYGLVKSFFDSYDNESVELFKPCESGMFKIGGKYRYHFLLKCAYKKDIYDELHRIYNEFKNRYKKVNFQIEVNPVNMY